MPGTVCLLRSAQLSHEAKKGTCSSARSRRSLGCRLQRRSARFANTPWPEQGTSSNTLSKPCLFPITGRSELPTGSESTTAELLKVKQVAAGVFEPVLKRILMPSKDSLAFMIVNARQADQYAQAMHCPVGLLFVFGLVKSLCINGCCYSNMQSKITMKGWQL